MRFAFLVGCTLWLSGSTHPRCPAAHALLPLHMCGANKGIGMDDLPRCPTPPSLPAASLPFLPLPCNRCGR